MPETKPGTLPPIDPTAYIRTYVPLLVGALLGWLVTTYTAVADVLAFVDGLLAQGGAGVNSRALLDTLAVALVTALYYWAARRLGRRWPWLERWLLGSASTPVYGLAAAEVVPAEYDVDGDGVTRVDDLDR